MHLKVIKSMAQTVPHSLGIPPLNDGSFAQALTSEATKMVGPSSRSNSISLGNPNDGRVNPLAAMGLSDDQYTKILQNLVNGEAFEDAMGAMGAGTLDGKRSLPESTDAPDAKRSRFEEIE